MEVAVDRINEAPPEPAAASRVIGGLPSRLLAVLLDYLFVTGLFLVLSQLLGEWAAFLIGLLYFTVFHGPAGSGRTLGKRAFHLRVVRLDGSQLGYGRAAARYMAAIGVVVLLTEIPPAIFRRNGVIAEPALLELHTLPVLAYMFANALRVIFDPAHRGLHDLLCRTVVVSTRSDTDAANPDVTRISRELAALRMPLPLAIAIPLLGGSIGGIMWALSVSQPPALRALMSARYIIEREAQIEIVGVSEEGTEGVIEGLDAAPAGASPDLAVRARVVADLVAAQGAAAAGWTSIRLRLHRRPGTGPSTEESSVPLVQR